MLPAVHRLTSSQDFQAAVRRGARAGTRTLVVHLVQGTGRSESAAGFVVSKAVGNAVIRNLVKRRLRAAVRERLAELPSGALLVVRALPAAGTTGYAQLRSDLDKALARVGVTPEGVTTS